MNTPWQHPTYWPSAALTGGLGLLLGIALHNGPVGAALACLGAMLPKQVRSWRRRSHRRKLAQALVTCLQQIAALTTVHGHPLPALQEVAQLTPGPLGNGLLIALQEHRSGTPLPVALQRLAQREQDDFCLHQLAALVELNLLQGSDLETALNHLAQRLHMTSELLAEQQAEIGLYRSVAWVFFGASVLPVLGWWLTGAPTLALLTGTTPGHLVLAWVVLSGLAVAWTPSWWEVKAP